MRNNEHPMLCRGQDREKYNALVRKEQEVNAYLDAFSELKHELTTEHASQQAEIRELRHRISKLKFPPRRTPSAISGKQRDSAGGDRAAAR